MKLVYDMRLLTGQMHGMARYGLELLNALLAEDNDLNVTALVRKERHGDWLPSHSRLKVLAHDLPPYGLKAQLRLPGLLKALKPDIYHCPFYAPPALYDGPLVFTVHDLIHLRFPQDHSARHRLFYRFVVGPAARRAKAVFTVSEHSKNDIVELLGVDPRRIVKTPNAVGAVFKPLTEVEKKKAAQNLNLPERYIMAVGNPKPHKNLAALIKAHQMLISSPPPGLPEPPALLLVGIGAGQLAGTEPGDKLILRPTMADKDLAPAYGAAQVVVMPSLYEGFGLPALEALACGAPLIVSDRASLPEVVGEAGLICQPDLESLAKAMGRVLADASLKDALAQAGPAQARKFSWRQSARTTLEVYGRIVEGNWP